MTTDRIRLSIDKFRDDDVPANIKSLKLYNEPKRQNQSHRVRLIVTALADGALDDGHNGVNVYMASHWEKVAD